MTSSAREQHKALDALEAPIAFTDSEVDRTKPDVKNAISARVSQSVSDGIIAEAVRLQQTPSKVINDLLTDALAARKEAAGDDPVIHVSELRRFISAAIAQAA